MSAHDTKNLPNESSQKSNIPTKWKALVVSFVRDCGLQHGAQIQKCSAFILLRLLVWRGKEGGCRTKACLTFCLLNSFPKTTSFPGR